MTTLRLLQHTILVSCQGRRRPALGTGRQQLNGGNCVIRGYLARCMTELCAATAFIDALASVLPSDQGLALRSAGLSAGRRVLPARVHTVKLMGCRPVLVWDPSAAGCSEGPSARLELLLNLRTPAAHIC